MQTKIRGGVTLGALVVAALLFGDALAGNYNETVTGDVEVYSVALKLGQIASYTGTDPDAVMVVDDLTYNVDLMGPDEENCEFDNRCELFPLIGGFGGPGGPGGGQPAGPSPAIDSSGTSLLPGVITRWTFARGGFFNAQMWDGQSVNGEGDAFDGISHTVYGTLHGRDVYYGTEGGDFPPNGTHGFPPREPFNTGGGGGGEPGSGGDGVGVGAGIGLGVFGTSTSASRHYQTPYVVISNVMFATPAPQGGGVSTYTRAAVYVKGRIFLDPATAPVRSADVTISTP